MKLHWFLERRRPYVLISIAVFAILGQILFFKFTYLDDYTLIIRNQAFLSAPQNLFRVFTVDFIASVSGGYYYRPLSAFTLILNAVYGHTSPFLYHLTNLILHAGVCLALFAFLERLSRNRAAALFFALVFAVHPAVLQTAAWIPARVDSLLALFALLSLLAWQKIFDAPSAVRHYALHALFFSLALASKETAIAIPGIAVLYLIFVRRAALRQSAKKILIAIPLWLVPLVFWTIARQKFIAEAAAFSISEIIGSIQFNFPAVLFYLGKIILPFNLSTYPILADSRLTLGFASLAVLGLGLLLSRGKRYGIVLFGLAWFAVFLLPALVRPNYVSYQEILEHRLYVPLIGIIIVAMEFGVFKKDWLNIKKYYIPAAAILLVLAIFNIVNARNYSDRLPYWAKAVKTSPSSSFAHKQLGAMYYLAGKIDLVEEHYRKAIELNPEETLVHGNLGLLLANRSELAAAEIEYKKEIKINPGYDEVYFNLGNLYFQLKRFSEAKASWERAVSINPYFLNVYRNLAIMHYQQGEYERGIEMLREINRHGGAIDPELINIYAPYLPKG